MAETSESPSARKAREWMRLSVRFCWPQETPRLAYQEAHYRVLSSAAGRLTRGKSPGGGSRGVALAIDAGQTRTSEGARSYSLPIRGDGLERVGTMRLQTQKQFARRVSPSGPIRSFPPGSDGGKWGSGSSTFRTRPPRDLLPRVQGDPSTGGPAPAGVPSNAYAASRPSSTQASERSCSAIPAEADHAVGHLCTMRNVPALY